ncbi:MAG TPA: glycosyltransferase family 2 protein [Dehalococcoidia bacterium]
MVTNRNGHVAVPLDEAPPEDRRAALGLAEVRAAARPSTNGLAEPRPAAPAPAVPAEQAPARPAEREDTRRGDRLQRLFEILPGAVTWLVITSPVWAGLFLPLPLAVAVIAFDFYWLYLSATNAYRAARGARELLRAQATDWRREYDRARAEGRASLAWDDVRHVVIIPSYRESEEKLARTLESLAQQPVADRIFVVLAMEAREEGAWEKAQRVRAPFQGRFAGFYCTLHPAGLPGEIVGKSSNEAWAARWAKRRLVDELGYSLDHLTVTSCDADTVFHPGYFPCLTYKFATDERRYRRFWQSPIFFYNNIWQTPAPLRVPSSLSGLHILSNLMKRNRVVFPQSTYSLSFRLAHEVGYWDTDVIPEDWHMFLKCYYAFQGQVEVEPILLPTGNDAVLAHGYLRTFRMAYQQTKRHAWGAADIAYALRQTLERRDFPLRRRLRRVAAVAGNHVVWTTHWFLLSLGWFVPAVVGGVFGVEGSPDWLPWLARVALTLCLVPYAALIAVDMRLRPPKPAGWKWWQTPLGAVNWLLLPVISFLISTVPAVESQTRLMLGKRLEYRVTEKA